MRPFAQGPTPYRSVLRNAQRALTSAQKQNLLNETFLHKRRIAFGSGFSAMSGGIAPPQCSRGSAIPKASRVKGG